MLPTSHSSLADLSIKLASHTWQDLEPRLSAAKADILAGTEEEDKSPGWSRLRNWHFWAPLNEKRDGSWHLVHANSRPRLFALLKELAQTSQASPGYGQLAGRILHHIQDMSTPSHAVGIFHGGPIKDPYEEKMDDWIAAHGASLKDLPAPDKPEADGPATPGIPGSELITAQGRALHRLYNDTAMSTHDKVDTVPFPEGAKTLLNLFWINKAKDRAPLRGHWGLLHKKQFGALNLVCPPRPGTPLQVSADDYDKVYALFNAQCVSTTAQALWLLYRQNP